MVLKPVFVYVLQFAFLVFNFRQIHFLCDEKTQLAVTYETIQSLPQPHSPSSSLSCVGFPNATSPSLLNPYAISNVSSPTLSESGSKTLSITRTPNICVEDGRIEFVKDEVESVQTHPNASSCYNSSNRRNNHNIVNDSHNTSNNNDRRYECIRHSADEKIDDAKVSALLTNKISRFLCLRFLVILFLFIFCCPAARP